MAEQHNDYWYAECSPCEHSWYAHGCTNHEGDVNLLSGAQLPVSSALCVRHRLHHCVSYCFIPGNLVLVEGLDSVVVKTATVIPEFIDDEVHIFRPLHFQTLR